jgi:glycosyltransferase involved in cell wall biosynthesis
MTKKSSPQIFIESTPLLDTHLSGIGHSLLSLIKELAIINQNKRFNIKLVVPVDKLSLLKQRTQDLDVGYKTIPLPARVMYVLMKFNLLPPLDIWLGTGVYVFPNYRNWPVRRSRSITFIHDLGFCVYPEFVSPKNLAFLKRNMPSWLRQTNIAVSISEQTKLDIIKYYNYPEAKINTIYLGVNPKDFYHRTNSEIDSVKHKYRLPSKYFIFLSTIEPRKNVENLLKAYKALPPEIRDKYGLVLIGARGWLSDTTVQLINKLQSSSFNIIWPQNYVPDEDLPALLSGATMLIHPSYYEGFGISPLQAMACRVPVIVANNSSMPEVVGKAGLYVDANNYEDLANKIVELVQDKEEQKNNSLLGYSRSKQFGWEKSAKQLHELIEHEWSELFTETTL